MYSKKRLFSLGFIAKRNYILLFILLIGFFVGTFSLYKVFLMPSKSVYVKIRVGQGLLWTYAARPNILIADALQKGDRSYDILGKVSAEVISVRKIPSWNTNQYDVDIITKLKVNENTLQKKYSYNRSPISIGSAINLSFPKADISGTIIDIQEKPIHEEYVNKIITLVNQGGYNKDFPYRYDSIQVGDKYFDGEDYIFEILDKRLEKSIWSIANNLTGTTYEQPIETTQSIVVKAKIKARKENNELFFGDYRITVNGPVPFSSSKFYFEGFLIRQIDN